MLLAVNFTLLDRLFEGLRDVARSCAIERYAAMDLERLRAMSDSELAYRGLAREDIDDYVARRYAT